MKFHTVLLCTAAIAGYSAPAWGQDAALEEAATDAASQFDPANVIIVQARRRDEDVQDVPAVIDTVTSAEVGKLNLRDFKDVATIVPGLQLTTESNGTGGNARMRGVNFDITASGNNPTVEFYFNDAPITAGVILQQMYDVGQIEVQRGPQGTLRGRAAPSGSITVTARKPDLYSFGGAVDLTANDIGTTNAKAAVNIPIIEGIAAIRAAGVWDEGDGDRVRSIYSSKGPYGRTKSGRISAIIQPTDWFKAEGLYQRLDRISDAYDQVASFSEANPDALPSPVYISTKDRLSTQENTRRIHQLYDIYNWRAEASFAGQNLIYQGQHYTQKISSTANQDGANIFPGDINQNTYSHPTSTSHEIRLQNSERVAGFLDYVAGFFDYKNSSPTELTRPTILGLPNGTLIRVVETEIERLGSSHEQSFFGNLTAHIGDAFELSAGGRHIDYSSNDATIVGGNTISTNGQDAKKWIYAASAKYNITRDLMVYASTGSSWRPGINVVGDFNLARSALEDEFTNLPAESSKSYEIGLKSIWLDGRLRANLTGYHQNFKNYPYRVGGDGVYFVNTVAVRNGAAVVGTAQQVAQFNFVGAVPVEVNGIEGDLNFSVTRRWSIGIVGSYSLGKIKNGTVPCNDLNGDNVPDVITAAPSLAQLQSAVGSDNVASCQVSQRSGFQAPFSASITSEYDLPISDKVDSYLRGLFSYNGNSQTDPTNPYDDVSDYGLLNLFAGIRDPGGAWEVSLFAKNVFDTTKTLSRTNPLFTSYLIPVSQTSQISTTATSTYTGVTATAPREFGINVRYAFGSR